MNWNKAKKLIIFVLIILNAALFGLSLIIKDSHTLTSDRERAVYEVLAKNGIALYTNISTDYSPMPSISVTADKIDADKILPAFFDDVKNLNMTIEFSNTIYSDGLKTLTLGENSVIYENPAALSAEDVSYNKALSEANAFCEVLKGAMGFSSDVIAEKHTENNNSVTFRYVETYNKNKIFCNYIVITVGAGGISYISSSRYAPGSMDDRKVAIAAPDEVMLTLLYELNRNDMAYGTVITDMEIGYDFQSSSEVAGGDSLKIVPYYRIYIQGQSEPIVINAYTNELRAAERSL